MLQLRTHGGQGLEAMPEAGMRQVGQHLGWRNVVQVLPTNSFQFGKHLKGGEK